MNLDYSVSKWKSGIPRIQDINEILNTDDYQKMRQYANIYYQQNAEHFNNYHYRWTRDALSHWSRIYEFPYCSSVLRANLPLKARVLDAGSGVTFFPFFLSSLYDVTCVDQDDYCDIYSAINAGEAAKVRFDQSPLSLLPYNNDSYDAVYCISVLEHTNEFERILKELWRVLRPGGILILTFDVSLDGNREGLVPTQVETLLSEIAVSFELNYSVSDFRAEIAAPDIYTTGYVRKWRESLLPWARPGPLSIIKDRLLLRTRLYTSIKMTFCNVMARKSLVSGL